MKTHLLISGDFVCTGGMDRANFALADYLSRSGDMVHLVGYRASAELTGRENVVFHRVAKIGNSYYASAPLLRRLGKVWSRKLGLRDGLTLVNGGNCDLPVVNWVHYVHAAYRPKRHGAYLRQLYQAVKEQTHALSERRALNKSPLLIVNSHRTQHDLVKHLNIPKERIRVVYYSVDLNQFYPESEEARATTRRQMGWSNSRKYILFVGSPSDPRKGFDTVLEAWQLLPESTRQDFVLAVLGHYRPEVMTTIKAAGLSNSIQLLGLRKDLPQILRASDALVSPTRYEAYGLAVHEAICSGIPAFVSSDAGVAERYPTELHNFLLSDPYDAGQLAERIQDWINNLEQSRAGWTQVSSQLRKYTWDDASQKILDHAELSC